MEEDDNLKLGDIQLCVNMATFSASHQAHKRFFQEGSLTLNRALSKNANLTADLWEDLYNLDDPQIQMHLFRVAPSRKLAAKLLTTTKENVRLIALANRIPCFDEALVRELILAPYFDIRYVAALICSNMHLPPDLATLLESRLLQEATLPGFDEENDYQYQGLCALVERSTAVTAADLLAIFDRTQQRLGKLPLQELAAFVDLRPALIPLLMQSPSEAGALLYGYYNAVSGSRHLDSATALQIYNSLLKRLTTHSSNSSLSGVYEGDYDLLTNLVENPNVAPQLKVAVCDLYIKTMGLVEGERPEPGERNWFQFREHFLQMQAAGTPPVTLPWEQLPKPQLLEAISDLGQWRFPTLDDLPSKSKEDRAANALRAEQQVTEISTLLDSLGPTAWDIFFGLMPSWKNSISDLLEVVKGATK